MLFVLGNTLAIPGMWEVRLLTGMELEGAVPPRKALHGYKPLIICFLSASCRLQWTELPAG